MQVEYAEIAILSQYLASSRAVYIHCDRVVVINTAPQDHGKL